MKEGLLVIDKEFLGTEKVSRLFVKLAVPSVVAQLVNLLYNMVDRIYIGHMENVGRLALTGVGVCMPVILIVSAFAAFVGMGGAPQVSIFMGKKDYDSAERTMGSCFSFLIIISLLLTAVLLHIRRKAPYGFRSQRKYHRLRR